MGLATAATQRQTCSKGDGRRLKKTIFEADLPRAVVRSVGEATIRLSFPARRHLRACHVFPPPWRSWVLPSTVGPLPCTSSHSSLALVLSRTSATSNHPHCPKLLLRFFLGSTRGQPPRTLRRPRLSANLFSQSLLPAPTCLRPMHP